MNKIVLFIVQIFLFPFPWFIRRLLLNLIPGFRINKKAKIGLSILLADKVNMEYESKITHFTFVNTIDQLHMKSYSKIGKSNWITGAHKNSKMFQGINRRCELILGQHARITGQHHIDCTGGVYIGDFTTIAGIRSQILTHSIDIRICKQVAGTVVIGKYCFVGTAVIILMDAALPDYSVLGAGSVLNKKYIEPYHLYAGSPAKMRKKFVPENYLYFTRDHGHVS